MTNTKARTRKAAKPVSEAEQWHAEAMAAPLAPPLSRDEAAALAQASPHHSVAILEPVAEAYENCRTLTVEDCDALTRGWLENGRLAALGPLQAWLDVPLPVSSRPTTDPAWVPDFSADLPPQVEVALVRFEQAHDEEDGTTVFEPGDLMTETFERVEDES